MPGTAACRCWQAPSISSELGELRSYDSLLVIFILEAFLALVRERTGNIAYVIGLHANFVMVVKTMKSFTAMPPRAQPTSLWAIVTAS